MMKITMMGLNAMRMLMLFSGVVLAEDQSGLMNKIDHVEFATLPGGKIAVRVRTTQPLANPPAGFMLNNPARIALDFPNVANGLGKNNLAADQGLLKSISIAQGKERTRMVLNLANQLSYNTSLNGNEVLVTLQPSQPAPANALETRFSEPKLGSQ